MQNLSEFVTEVIAPSLEMRFIWKKRFKFLSFI